MEVHLDEGWFQGNLTRDADEELIRHVDAKALLVKPNRKDELGLH